MKQKIEKVIRNKKVAIALMECLVAIGLIIAMCILMMPKDKVLETTYSYSKVEEVTEYKVVGNYISRVRPRTTYETFKEVAENTLNKASEDVQYTVKVYQDTEKTEEVTDGYIASGMIVEAIAESESSTENTKEITNENEVLEQEVEGSTNEELTEEVVAEKDNEGGNKNINYVISVIGDITKDGDINVTELTKIIKGVIGLSEYSFTEEEKISADISGDGEINVVDIELCINYIVFGELELEEPQYTVTFKDYDGKVISTKKDYHYGDTVEMPEEPTRETDETYTYEFAGWVPVISEKVTKDEVYIATYKAIEIETKAAYKVEHYKETLEGTYELAETEKFNGEIGEEAAATAKEYTGFSENVENENRITSGTVLEDGSLVLKLYYNRNTYTVTFKDENGTEINTKAYKYGDTVEVPENPSKEEDNTYTYEFAGWTPEVEETVTKDVEYTATYKGIYKEYTVTFKNEDGSVINSTVYHYGDTVELPENPIKAEDETYTYEFAGWTPEVEETVTGNVEYIATYESTYKEYTIEFKDEDGTIISTNTYHYGDTIEVPENPSKTEDETYTYEFAGWDKEITTVAKDEVYTATYINKYKEYTIVFKQDDGTILNSTIYHYGDKVKLPKEPAKEATIEHTYTFVGWTPEVEETVTKNAEYTAIYEEKEIEYTIIFYNDDGETEVSRIEDYIWGDSFVFPASPTKEPTEEIKYVFYAWENLGLEEVSDTEKILKLVAQYTEEYFVARVEETETLEGVSYLTLEEAIENAGSEARTIRMLTDTEESVMIEDNQNITLNLNGKTIIGTKNYAIKNYGVLVITDETEEKLGKIKDIVSSEVGYGIHNRDGKVTIKGGTIVTETSQESGATYGIYNQSEQPLVIEGGSVIAEAKGKASVSAGIYNLAGEEIQVSGGIVLGNALAESSTGYGIYNETEGIINVTNGRVEGKTSLASGISYGIYNEISNDVTISGGTVAAQSDKNMAYGVYNKEGKVSVTGGTIEITATTGYGIYNETGALDVGAGKITTVGSTSYGISNNAGTINISGGSIELTSSRAYGIYNNSEMNVTGGEITGKTSGSSTYGIYNNSEKNLSIQNVNVSGLDYGIYNYKGELTIVDSIITATYGVYNYRGEVILKSANVVSNQYGVYNSGIGNIEIGIKDQNISTEIPNIFGKTNAIYNDITSSGTIKYYDGILTGKTAIYGGINEIEDNSEIVITTDEEGNEVAILQKIEEIVVAKIGENTYTNLASAVEAVSENAEETATIEIVTDFDISTAVEIPVNKNVTINLAGHTVRTYAKGGITNKGTLEITDTTEGALGKIVSGIGVGISNEGNFTLTSGTIESNQYGIYNYDDGNVVAQGGNVQGTTAICNSSVRTTITVKDGGQLNSAINNAAGIVNIEGGSIKGIFGMGGTINVNGGQIKSDTTGINSDSGNINITGGEIISESDYGIVVYNGVNVNITGGEIKGTTGIKNYRSNVTIGTKDGDLNQETPNIVGETYGIDTTEDHTGMSATLKYYDGKIAGKTGAIYGSINEIETGKKVELNTETINEEEYQATSLVDEDIYENGIAQIGDNVYKTVYSLKQAISEIEINTEEAVKVIILNDFEMTQVIEISSNQNVKIDLNGKTITTTSSIMNKGNLEITDNTENCEGKFINTNNDGIINRGTLSIAKGTIEGARYGIYTFSSNVTLGTEDGEVDDTAVVIKGEKRGVYTADTFTTIEMYDGILKGKNSSLSAVSKTEEGYKVYNYKEGDYYITALQLESPIARTGGQDYGDLQTAIDNCEDGRTVEILRSANNIKNTVTIAEDKNIALDLKGYTITTDCETFLINNGILNISTSNGTIRNNTNGITVKNNGELNLLKGTIYSNYGRAIENNGVLNVAGGTIYGYSYGINNKENATLTITSGRITSYQYAVYNNSTNAINMTGGVINVYSGNASLKYGIYNNVTADINITGGTINSGSYDDGYIYGIYNNANGNTLISTSGAISVYGKYAYGIYNNAEGNVTMEEGTIYVSGTYLAYGIRNTSKGKVGVAGGNITVTSNDGYAYGIENGTLGTVEITSGTITAKTSTATSYGIKNMSVNSLTIKQATIKATGTQSYGIHNNTSDLIIGENNGEVTTSSPIIESDFVGIYINEVGTKFNFYDGQVIGQQPINVDANVPEGYKLLQYYDNDKQKEVAIPAELDSSILTYYVDDEIYKVFVIKPGSDMPEHPTIPEKEGYIGWWSDYYVKEQNIEVQAIYVEEKAVINKTKAMSYDSIETAVASVDTDGTINEMYLLENVTTTSTITVPQNANIILDLNSYTITNSSTYRGIDNYGTLTIEDNSEAKTGALIVNKTYSNSYGIYNRSNASATVNSININVTTTSGYAGTGIYNNSNASITLGIKDGVVNAETPRIQATTYGINNSSGTLNFYDGKVLGTTSMVGSTSEAEVGYRIVTNTDSETNLEVSYLSNIPNGTTFTATDENGITWNYTYIDGQATNVYYKSGTLPEEVMIPAQLNEYPVKSLYNNGSSRNIFAQKNYATNSTIKKVIIPDGVTSIGYAAFYGCTALTNIEIPNTVTSMGRAVFSNCTSLRNISIPKGMTSIEGYLFAHCSGLESIEIPEGITSIGDNAFYGCSSLTDVNIPDTVTSMEYTAFSSCTSLTSVVIPGSVVEFGAYVFSNCTNLKNVEILDGITAIGDYAFQNCTSLTSIDIPDSVTNIENSAFSGCTGLTGIEIPNSVTSIGSYAFYSCTALTNIQIPDNVTNIGNYAFYSCTALTNIKIPDSVITIGNNAFSYCTSLTSIEVEENNKNYCSIDGVLFNKDKTQLIQYPMGKKETEYEIPNSVTSIGSYAFYSCTALTNIKIPDSVTDIGDYAFSNTAWYDNQPDGVLYIGNVVYKYKGTMPNNTSITIPNNITSIGSYAFDGCTGLTEITIPSSVTTIKRYAFNDCTSLTEITIPNSITSIEEAVFRDCTSLKSIEISNSVTKIENYAFCGCTGLTSIEIPNSVTSIGSSAFSGCTGLTEITIPNSITSIGSSAFYNCSNLATIEISESTPTIGSNAFYNTAWYNNQANGVVYIGKVAYKYKGSMSSNTSIKLKDGTKIICDSLFNGYSVLRNIEIPNSVTYIGNYAFNGCTGLSTIEIPNSVTYIGGYAFNGCTGLTTIEIPNSVTSIGNRAFYGCTGLTYINISYGITYIGTEAFAECTSLINIQIPDSVVNIGIYAFENTPWYNNQVDGVVYIGKVLYEYKGTMANDTVIEIEDGITSINDYAFENCIGLKSITMPESVTNIGYYAFSNCRSLTNITISNNIAYIDYYAFAGCTSLEDIVIPESVLTIKGYAFNKWTANQTINIEADEVPETWDESWNYGCNATIVYGYTGE